MQRLPWEQAMMLLRRCRVFALFAALLCPLTLRAQGGNGTNPHGALSSHIDCSACHTPTGWTPAKNVMDFDHNSATSFALNGRHAEATCASCHLGLRFDQPRIANNDCRSCHVDVHQGRLSDNCVSCHNTTTFNDVAGVSVHARTSFPLTGTHLQISCETCHADDRGGAFTTLDSDCLSCHQDNYESAASIDHVALQFSTNCEDCHTTLGWGGGAGTFDHVSASGFDLVGAHAQIRCESCHVVPGLAPIFPTSNQDDCIGCHQTDYDSEHGGTGFPTDCLACHNQDNWGDATFENHDQQSFPIFTGKHKGKWDDDCQTCHNVGGNFQVFTCLNCHEHRQDSMDEKHKAESGYVYESNACLSCHPDGRKER